MKKILYLLILLTGIIPVLKAQPTDSLQIWLKSANGNVEKAFVWQKAFQQADLPKEQKMAYIDQALLIAKEHGIDSIIPQFLENKATLLPFEQAVNTRKEAIIYYQKTGQLEKLVAAYRRLASEYNKVGQTVARISYEMKAYHLAMQLGNKALQRPVAMTLANAMGVALGNYQVALEYQIEAERLTVFLNEEGKSSTRELATAKNNLGSSYKDMKMFPEALELLYASMLINTTHGHKPGLIYNYATLSEVYQLMGNMDSAYHYVQILMTASLESGNLFDLAYAHNDLGRVLNGMGKYQQAIPHLEKAYTEAKTMLSGNASYREIIDLANRNLYDAYVALKRYDKAFPHLHRMHDELAEKRNATLAIAKEQMDLELQRVQTEERMMAQEQQLRQDKALQQQQFTIYASLGTLSFVLLGLGFAVRSRRMLGQQHEEVKRQQVSLQKAYSDTQLLSDIGKDITARLELRQIIEVTYKNANQLMDAYVFGIGILDSKKKCIEMHVMENGKLEDISYDYLEEVERISVRCALRQEEINIHDYEQEYIRFSASIPPPKTGESPRSIMYLPLMAHGNCIGVVTVQSMQAGVYSDYQMSLLKNIAIYTAIALENYHSFHQIEEQNEEIASQRDAIAEEKIKSEQLLMNILPQKVAYELKEKGHSTPLFYPQATILFADFVGFTQLAENMTAHDLVAQLNTIFSAFDDIVRAHNLEKIKTIGDAYMCAGGVPEPNISHPTDAIKVALAMQEYVKSQIGDAWQLRVGIHTGPVTAGVVGKHKFAFDIWGDAVNLAARMEQSGVGGSVNISQNTYELVRGRFQCQHRGKVKAKNKGEVDMYLVES